MNLKTHQFRIIELLPSLNYRIFYKTATVFKCSTSFKYYKYFKIRLKAN